MQETSFEQMRQQRDAIGPFRRSKQLPEIIEILTETYQLPSVNPYKLLSLSKQLPLMQTIPLKKN